MLGAQRNRIQKYPEFGYLFLYIADSTKSFGGKGTIRIGTFFQEFFNQFFRILHKHIPFFQNP
jgi:hypothetical protein